MTKKELELKQNIHIDEDFEVPENFNYNHDLITKISNLHVEGAFKYHESIKTVDVRAFITALVSGIDSRDGSSIELEQEVEWNDQYVFELEKGQPESNLVLGDEFNILEYAIEQIVLNIPINFSKNNGKIDFVGKDFKLLSEEEYQEELDSKMDPRWEKLKDFKVDK